MFETTSLKPELSVLTTVISEQMSGQLLTGKQVCDFFTSIPAVKDFLEMYQLQYQKKSLFLEAFIHSSYIHEFPATALASYEKLEFLGDSVINLFFTNLIFTTYPQQSEGAYSKLRSALVNSSSLALLARFLDLSRFILMGKGEFQNRLYQNENIQADVFESLVGSIFLDQGPVAAQNFLRRVCSAWGEARGADFCDIVKLQSFDAKTKLQEYCLKQYKQLPIYQAHEVGGDFQVEVWIDGKCLGEVQSSSKKKAQKLLAQQVLENLEKQDNPEKDNNEMRCRLC